jgi:hypothetical protein
MDRRLGGPQSWSGQSGKEKNPCPCWESVSHRALGQSPVNDLPNVEDILVKVSDVFYNVKHLFPVWGNEYYSINYDLWFSWW